MSACLIIFAMWLTNGFEIAIMSKSWPKEVEQALANAGDNRSELEKALETVPLSQRPDMAFLIANMPDADLKSLKAGPPAGNSKSKLR